MQSTEYRHAPIFAVVLVLFFLSHCKSSVKRSSLLCSADRSVPLALSSFRYGKVCLRGSELETTPAASAVLGPMGFLTMPNFRTLSFPTVTSFRVLILLPSMVTMRSPTSICPRKVHAGSMWVILAPPSGTIRSVSPSLPGETVSMRMFGNGSLSLLLLVFVFVVAFLFLDSSCCCFSTFFFARLLSSVCLDVGLRPFGFLQFLHLHSS
mmetsp:Transcript_6957/g.12390  ORF Transcript_6957/g.12390 Transcript_6957/m.12390 type:complete len:209 (+) Transcript_6957:1482-2108(+)